MGCQINGPLITFERNKKMATKSDAPRPSPKPPGGSAVDPDYGKPVGPGDPVDPGYGRPVGPGDPGYDKPVGPGDPDYGKPIGGHPSHPIAGGGAGGHPANPIAGTGGRPSTQPVPPGGSGGTPTHPMAPGGSAEPKEIDYSIPATMRILQEGCKDAPHVITFVQACYDAIVANRSETPASDIGMDIVYGTFPTYKALIKQLETEV
jgi:hypothetical protein